jgi:hypothetical protein
LAKISALPPPRGERLVAYHHRITTEAGWHVYHVVWRVKGSLNRLDNLGFVHLPDQITNFAIY